MEPPVVSDESSPPPDPQVCANHPSIPATVQCSRCHVLWCPACVNKRRAGSMNLEFCTQCGAICAPLESDHAAEETVSTNFATEAFRAFAYPWKGNGPILLASGTVFFALTSFLSMIPFVGMLIGFFATGYFCLYLLNIIQDSARGEGQMPSWPDVGDFKSDVLPPLLMFLGVLALCFGPGVLFRLFWAKSHPELNWVTWWLLSAGGLYWPMCVLAVALFDDLSAANPLLVVPSILKVLVQYLLACGILLLLFGATLVSDELGNSMPLIGGLVGGFFSLYLAVVEMRVLGLIYYCNKSRLAWF